MSLAPNSINQLYSVTEISQGNTQTSQLRILDPNTGTYTVAGDLAFSTYAITRDAQTGRIYYVEKGANGRVAYWDPQTQTNTVLSQQTGITDSFLKLAQAVDGQIYGLGSKTVDLYTIDPNSGKATSLGPVTGGSIPFSGGSGDIAFDPNNADRLFAITTGQGYYRLYSIDLPTRTATLIGETGLRGDYGTGSLGFVDGKLYASAEKNLYELNQTTAQPTLAHNLGYISEDFAVLPIDCPNQAPEAKDVKLENVQHNSLVNINKLTATDTDGDAIVSYTITSLPAADQGVLYLGDPTQGGSPISVGQVLTPEQVNQLRFQTTDAFKDASFQYTATSGVGARQKTDLTPATVHFTPQECQGGCCPIGEIIHGNRHSNTIKGTGYSDTVYGHGGKDVLRGSVCHDTLDGGRGKDRLFGGEGNDTLYGRRKHDRLNGNEGDDLLNGNVGKDRLRGGEGQDQLYGGRGEDWLHGNGGNDRLLGKRRSDKLIGGTGHDELFGNGGRDIVRGNRSKDIVNGGLGQDKVYGGGGRDTIVGFYGDDVLVGGKGADRFVCGSLKHGTDQIVDFQVRDRIDLSQVFTELGLQDVGKRFTYLRLTQVGADTQLQIDANGLQNGFKAQTIQVLENFAASNFSRSNVML